MCMYADNLFNYTISTAISGAKVHFFMRPADLIVVVTASCVHLVP